MLKCSFLFIYFIRFALLVAVSRNCVFSRNGQQRCSTMLPPCKHFLRHLYYQMYRKNRETDQVNAREVLVVKNTS